MLIIIVLLFFAIFVSQIFGGGERRLSYLLVGDTGMPVHHPQLKKWNGRGKVDLFFFHTTGGRLDKSFYDTPCRGMNMLTPASTAVVDDKATLGRLLAGQSFMPQNVEYSRGDDLAQALARFGGKVIFKPSALGYFSGRGVRVFDATNISEIKAYLANERAAKFTIQEYLTDVMLFRGKKFHFRCFFWVDMYGAHATWNEGEILTAKKKYDPEAINDPEIFISRGPFTGANIYISDHPEITAACTADGETFEHQLRNITAAVAPLIHGEKFPNCDYAFEVLALDIIPLASGRCMLSEVNTRVGFGANIPERNRRRQQKYSQDFYDWLLPLIRPNL